MLRMVSFIPPDKLKMPRYSPAIANSSLQKIREHHGWDPRDSRMKSVAKPQTRWLVIICQYPSRFSLFSWTGGPFTGASLNPARSLGPSIVFMSGWHKVGRLWLPAENVGLQLGFLMIWHLGKDRDQTSMQTSYCYCFSPDWFHIDFHKLKKMW